MIDFNTRKDRAFQDITTVVRVARNTICLVQNCVPHPRCMHRSFLSDLQLLSLLPLAIHPTLKCVMHPRHTHIFFPSNPLSLPEPPLAICLVQKRVSHLRPYALILLVYSAQHVCVHSNQHSSRTVRQRLCFLQMCICFPPSKSRAVQPI